MEIIKKESLLIQLSHDELRDLLCKKAGLKNCYSLTDSIETDTMYLAGVGTGLLGHVKFKLVKK